MKYAPITWEKTISDFPSNKEFGLNNSAVVRTRLIGEDSIAIVALYNLKKLNEATGEMESAVTGSDLLVKIMEKAVLKWTFTDIETGELYDINEKNIRELLLADFNYLSGEVSPLMDQLLSNNEDAPEGTEPETAPHTAITEDEKKESAAGSESES